MKVFLWLSAVLSLLFTVFFSTIFVIRAGLSYNEEGKYFDPESSIVYSEQAKMIYGILAVAGFIMTGLLLYTVIRHKKNKQ